MQPYDYVRQHYNLPYNLYPFQEEAVNGLAPLPSAGYYLDVGTGKTLTSITSCLYKLHTGEIKHVICLMPPILITNWSRNLGKIPGVSHVCYRGSPKQREKLDLDVNFILMSYQIFKRDFEYLFNRFAAHSIAVLCDEAQAIKNVGSDTHKRVRDFAVGNELLLLTGTPLSVPLDGYAYIKLVAPGIYRNLLMFEQLHVEDRDFLGKPKAWCNLDLLRENLKVNSRRVLKEDVLKDLPPVTYTELWYDLNPKHEKLYKELAENQLKVFDDGTKLDLTHVSALFNALQQIPANAEHFSGGEMESTIDELIEEIMDELGDGKLVIFTKYIMTNRRLLKSLEGYGVRAIYGDTKASDRQKNIDTFVNDPTCRIILLQLQSASAGVDTIQGACKDILFVELPHTAAAFTQAVARVHRQGQKHPVQVRVALAERTIQGYCWKAIQKKDSLINLCIRGPADLRDVALGVKRERQQQAKAA